MVLQRSNKYSLIVCAIPAVAAPLVLVMLGIVGALVTSLSAVERATSEAGYPSSVKKGNAK